MKIKETLDIENTEFNEEFIDYYLNTDNDSLITYIRLVDDFLARGDNKIVWKGSANQFFSLAYRKQDLLKRLNQLKCDHQEYKTNLNDATISPVYLDGLIAKLANSLTNAIFAKRIINFLLTKVIIDKPIREIGLWEKLRAMFR